MYVSSEGQVGGELKKKERRINKEKNENTSNVTGNANIRFEKYGWEWGERGRGAD